MPIQYVGGQTASVAASTATNTNITFSLTGGLASTPAAGDFVIVAYSIGSTVARTPAINTAGYTQLTALNAADSFDANLRVGYKTMGGTPDTQVQVGPTANTADSGFVTIHVFRNVNATTPLDVTHTTATASNSGTPDPAAITPATAGNWIYVVGANGRGTTGTMTASYLTAFLTSQNIATTNRTTMGAGYVTGQSAGVSYNPAAFTWSANVNTQGWAAYTIALRPAINAITANDLQSQSNVTSPALTQIVTSADLLANDLQSVSTVQTVAFTQTHALLANDLQSQSNVTQPVISQVVNLLANDLQSVSSVTSPSLGVVTGREPRYGLAVYGIARYKTDQPLANDLQSLSQLTRPTLAIASSVDLLANDLRSDSNVSTPSLGVIRNLLANDLQSQSNVTQPVIAQRHSILANDLQSLSQNTRPTIVQSQVLLANDLRSVSTVQTVNVGQKHNLLANDLQSASNVSRPVVRQTQIILANDLASVSQVSRPLAAQANILLANDLQSVSSVQTVNVGQKHTLNANDLQSSSTVQDTTLSLVRNLLANDLQSASNVASVGFTAILPAEQDTTRTVYIPQEVFTLYINSDRVTTNVTVLPESKQKLVYQPERNTTVYVQADNRKVYVGRNVA